MKVLTAAQAAEKLGVSVRRVQQLVQSGRLPANVFGGALMIKESDLTLVAERKPGRPKGSDKVERKTAAPRKKSGR